MKNIQPAQMYDQYWCIFSEIFLHDCCDNSRLGVSQWSQSASSDPRVHVHVNSDLISLRDKKPLRLCITVGVRSHQTPGSDHFMSS